MRHELNNLLQVITTQLELIALRVGDDARVSASVAAALDAAHRVHTLVSDHRREVDPPVGAMPSAPALSGPMLSAKAERPLRIVLSEDDALVRATMNAVLADLGHVVIETGTAGEALDAIDVGADVLITDLNLPDGNGADLADDALARHPGLAVIIASGDERPGPLPHVWLQKPFNGARLRAALEAAMAAG
jgi:CheY-like chemotaxis protein